MPRVVLVSSTADPVGVSKHILGLAKLLHDRGWLDRVICPRSGWLSDVLERHQIPCQVVPLSFRPSEYPRSALALARALRSSSRGTVVHAHGRMPLFLLAPLALVGPKRVLVATVHQFSSVRSKRRLDWKRLVETILLRKMSRVWCVSDDLAREVRRRIGASRSSRVTVIPNWVPDEGGQPPPERHWSPPRQQRAARLCGVGRLAPEKGFDLLIEAVARLNAESIPVECDLYGDGEAKSQLAEQAVRLGVSDRVRFHGFVNDARGLIGDHDILVIPSRSESFGLVALEAYGASVPVIASRTSGLRGTVVDGTTGLLFDVGSVDSLMERVKEALRPDFPRDRIVRQARQYLSRFQPQAHSVELFYKAACSE